MDVVMTIVRCAPISFQLAGALVVICVLSLSGSIDDVLNHTKVIATIPNEDSSRIYINKDISKMSVEKKLRTVLFVGIYNYRISWCGLGRILYAKWIRGYGYCSVD